MNCSIIAICVSSLDCSRVGDGGNEEVQLVPQCETPALGQYVCQMCLTAKAQNSGHILSEEQGARTFVVVKRKSESRVAQMSCSA
jgi:hypothetical protein